MVSDVVEAVEKVLAAGKKTGKRIGSIVRKGESPKQYVTRIFRTVTASLSSLIVDSGQTFLEDVKGKSR